MDINDYFEGIKTGNNLRIVLRNPREIRNSPAVGYSVRLSNDEQRSLAVITSGNLDDNNILDLTIMSYYKDGHRIDDGQVSIYVIRKKYEE